MSAKVRENITDEEISEQVGGSIEDPLLCPFYKDPEFMALTRLQQKFILGYLLKDTRKYTLAQIYKWASGKFDHDDMLAGQSAKMLKMHPKVSPFLEKIDRLWLEELGITLRKVLEEEKAIAFSDVTQYFDDDGCITIADLKRLPPMVRRVIKDVELITIPPKFDSEGNQTQAAIVKAKVSLWDKGQSLTRLQKIQGFYAPEKKELSGEIKNKVVNYDEQAKATRDRLLADAAKINATEE